MSLSLYMHYKPSLFLASASVRNLPLCILSLAFSIAWIVSWLSSGSVLQVLAMNTTFLITSA